MGERIMEIINKQTAIDALMSEPPGINYNFYYAEKIKKVPNLQIKKRYKQRIDVLKFIADNAGLNLTDVLQKAYDQGYQDTEFEISTKERN